MAMLGALPYQQVRDAVLTHPTMGEGLNLLFDARGREFKSRQPDGKGPGGGDLLDCMKAPKTLNGHRFRTFRTLRFRTRGRLMKNCRCPVVYASCGTSRSCSRTSCTSARGRPDPPDRARAGPTRLAGTCPRFAAGPAPLTPKTYCFASSRTLIRD